MSAARECPGCGARKSRRAGRCRSCWRRGIDELHADLDGVAMGLIGRTGLSTTLRSVRRALGRDPRPPLGRLVRAGRIGRMGDRYFPAAWLRGPGP